MRKLLSLLLALALCAAAPLCALAADDNAMTAKLNYDARTEEIPDIGVSIAIPSDWKKLDNATTDSWYFYAPDASRSVNLYRYTGSSYANMTGYYLSTCEKNDESDYHNGAFWTINGREFFVCEYGEDQLFAVFEIGEGGAVDARLNYQGGEAPWDFFYSMLGSIANLDGSVSGAAAAAISGMSGVQSASLDEIGLTLQYPDDWHSMHDAGETSWSFFSDGSAYHLFVYVYGSDYPGWAEYAEGQCAAGELDYQDVRYETINGREFLICYEADENGAEPREIAALVALDDERTLYLSLTDASENETLFLQILATLRWPDDAAPATPSGGTEIDIDGLVNEGLGNAPAATAAPQPSEPHLLTQEEINSLVAEFEGK